MQRDKLLILGADGHGRVIADIALRQSAYKHIVFLDDDELIPSFAGIEVIGPTGSAYRYIVEYDMVIAIGDNRTRASIQRELEVLGGQFPVLVHPEAIIGTSVTFGQGTVVMAGAVLNCGTHVGSGCVVNTAAVVDHDGEVEDFVHLSPGSCLAGTVTIGTGTWIGTGAHISNNLTICENCVIGAGATVIRNITIPGTYIGIPARRIRSRNEDGER